LGPDLNSRDAHVAASEPQAVGSLVAGGDQHDQVATTVNYDEPVGQAYLFTCLDTAGNRSCSVGRPISIMPITPPSAAPSASADPPVSQLLEAAVAQGKLTQQTAMQYEGYALTLDPRLPLAYQSDNLPDIDQFLGNTIALGSTSLSDEYSLPPFDPGSWWANRYLPNYAVSQGTLLTPTDSPGCGIGSGPLLGSWSWEPKDGSGHVKVWYETKYPAEDVVASYIANAVNTQMWPLYTQIMGRQPLSDNGSTRSCRGGDDRLDIALDETSISHTNIYAPDVFTNSCSGPVYIELNNQWVTSPINWQLPAVRTGILETTAHELFHAFQRAVPYSRQICLPTNPYKWFMEGSANWAEDSWITAVNPPGASSPEVGAMCQLLAPRNESLDYTDGYHEYGTSLFDKYMADDLWRAGYRFNFVGKVFDELTSAAAPNPLIAMTQILGSSVFAYEWDKFVRVLFNHSMGPLVDDYSRFGHCSSTVDASSQDPFVTGTISPGVTSLDVSVPHASYRTLRFTLPPSVSALRLTIRSSVELGFTIAWHPGAPPNSAEWEWVPGSSSRPMSYCIVVTSHSNRELDLLLANSDVADAASGTVSVSATNTGCVAWQGTIDGRGHIDRNDGATVDVSWHAAATLFPDDLTHVSPEKFGFDRSLVGHTSSASGDWSFSSFNPNPFPGCPSNYAFQNQPFSGGANDGLVINLFPDDVPSPGYSLVGTTDPSVTTPVPAYCWEANTSTVFLGVPWIYGGPVLQAVTSDGQSITGSYTERGSLSDRSWTYTWTWSFTAVNPLYPLSPLHNVGPNEQPPAVPNECSTMQVTPVRPCGVNLPARHG
jgi:hypothetical protein